MGESSSRLAEPPVRAVRVERWPPNLHIARNDGLGAAVLGGCWLTVAAGTALVGPELAVVMYVLGGAGTVGGLGLIAAPWLTPNRLRRTPSRRVQRALRRSHGPVPIAQARGWAHVRGKVRVLRGVPEPVGEGACAAWARTGWVRTQCRCVPQCPSMYDADETESQSGRFAIVDDTGAAVIDSEHLDLARRSGTLPRGGVTLLVREGDTIDALGHVEPAHDPAARALAPVTSYREGPQAVQLSGSKRRPVALVLA